MKLFVLAALTAFFGSVSHAHPGHGGHLVFTSQNVHAHLSWVQGPDGSGGESKMQIEWHDAATHAIIEPTFNFDVVLWMPSMGHGSAPTQIDRAVDGSGKPIVGTFLVSNMIFLMPGDWEVRVAIQDKSGTQETQALKVNVAGSGEHKH